jgi:2',3'-cyclic-nucleotide 2'-phosphodiesterase (5'-nucleotidase family)
LSEFQNLSVFSNVVKDLRTTNTIVLIPGDMLGVCVTSILDKGVTVIELLNRIGVDIVTLGSSEANVPPELLAQRISDFKGKCLNSNLPHLPHQMPEYEIVQVRGPGGSMRKVGLVGICTHCNPVGTGGEAWKTSLPAVEAVARLRKKLVEEFGCDVVVPITNQIMFMDEALAREVHDLPLIIGVCVCACVRVCVCVCVCVYYICMYVCLYICMYVCIYIYNIYTYTYTYT